MLVQVRTSPKHRSTHIPNYQSTERESYDRDCRGFVMADVLVKGLSRGAITAG